MSRHEVLDAYVRQTLIRTFLDERRRGWSRRERTTDVPADRPQPADSPEDRLVVLAALAAVPPRQRAVLVLRYGEDPVEDTANRPRVVDRNREEPGSQGLADLRGLLTPIASGDETGGVR